MILELDTEGTLEGLEAAMARAAAASHVHTLIVLTCSDNGFTPEQLNPLLAGQKLPLIGGVFPALIFDNRKIMRGSVVWGMRRAVALSVIEQLSDPANNLDDAVEAALPDEMPDSALQLVLVDGFSKRIGELISVLHEQVGLTDTIGGGAGSLDFVQRPCLLTNGGMLEDAAVIATISGRAGVGVAHGWNRIEGPFRVTESHQNTIVSLDWRPAFDVYREVVEAHSGQAFHDDNFFDLAKAYPFGITRLDSERVVRDPLMVGDGGSLICVGEVPQGEHLDILNGDEPSLIAAAASAREMADARLQGPLQLRFFVDCISRVLFLGDAFDVEVAAVATDDSLPLIGVCSIGEIANHGGDFLEFYNKTSVVAALPRADFA